MDAVFSADPAVTHLSQACRVIDGDSQGVHRCTSRLAGTREEVQVQHPESRVRGDEFSSRCAKRLARFGRQTQRILTEQHLDDCRVPQLTRHGRDAHKR
eukprot:scaffold105399_cov31-Tisochrysis_lutea.AAC.3